MPFLTDAQPHYTLAEVRQRTALLGELLEALETIAPMNSMETKDQAGYHFFKTFFATLIAQQAATSTIDMNFESATEVRTQLRELLDAQPVPTHVIAGTYSYLGAMAFTELLTIYLKAHSPVITQIFKLIHTDQSDFSTTVILGDKQDELITAMERYQQSLNSEQLSAINNHIQQCRDQVASHEKVAEHWTTDAFQRIEDAMTSIRPPDFSTAQTRLSAFIKLPSPFK